MQAKNSIQNNLGDFIRNIRRENGYTIDDFSHLLGVSRGTLINYEQLKTTVSPKVVKLLRDKFPEYFSETLKSNTKSTTKNKEEDSMIYETPIDCGEWVLVGYNVRFVKKAGLEPAFNQAILTLTGFCAYFVPRVLIQFRYSAATSGSNIT